MIENKNGHDSLHKLEWENIIHIHSCTVLSKYFLIKTEFRCLREENYQIMLSPYGIQFDFFRFPDGDLWNK